MYAAGRWHDLPELPPKHIQVLVEFIGCPTFTTDVACYVGEYERPFP
jgi:hypothetical protein